MAEETTHNPNTILNELRSVCGELKKRLDQAREAPSGEARDELLELCCMSLLKLRRSNRAAHDVAHGWLGNAEEARQKTDQVFLRLQNLQYEKNHLKKEIQLCQDFTVRNVEDLVDKDAFLAKGPENLVTAPDQHTLELNRLTFEMEERKRLVGNMKTQEMRKRVYESSIMSKRNFLGSLGSHLGSVTSALQPIKKEFQKEALGLTVGGARYQEMLHLPPSLYNMFYQVVSYQETFHVDLQASVAGDFEAAAQPVAIEEDSVASRRAKRGKADENLTEKHPLHVTFTVSTHSNGVHKADSPSPPAIGVQISVFFLPRLGIVTVTHMLTDETGLHPAQISDLLADLYPGDSGTESPNPENVLPQKDMFDSIKTGRPYRWAQTVCGLEFPGSKREECGENTFISDAIGRISDRIRHALTLARLVASLGRHVLPPLLNAPSDLPDASAIQSWSTVADPMLVDTDNDRSQRFEFTLSQSGWVLNGCVSVGCGYPSSPPVFANLQLVPPVTEGLGASDDAASRERFVTAAAEEANVLCPKEVLESGNSDHGELLGFQMRGLLLCLAVYLDCKGDSAGEPFEQHRDRYRPLPPAPPRR